MTKPTNRYRELFTHIEAYIGGYVALPEPIWTTILALWAIGTHTFQSFDAFPYSVITAAVPRVVKEHVWATAHAEADALRAELKDLAFFRGDIVDTDVFGREAEIWSPLFALARVWCPDRQDALVRIAADLAASKTLPKRRYTEVKGDEATMMDVTYGERALRDLATVLDGGRYILSVDAVGKLREIASAPWRRYKGDGLTPIVLANLLNPFNVAPKQFKVKGKVLRGYARADVISAVAVLGKVAG